MGPQSWPRNCRTPMSSRSPLDASEPEPEPEPGDEDEDEDEGAMKPEGMPHP
jgi:hypothetical protein